MSANLTAASTIAPMHSRWRADVILLSTAVMWGVNIVVFKYAIAGLSPWTFNGLRLVFATLTLGILAWAEAKFYPVVGKAKPVDWPRVLVFCGLSGLLYMLLFVRGIEQTTAGNTALILASMPMWTAVLSFFVLSERLKRITWIGLFVTLIGTVIVTTQSSGPVDVSGEFFVGNCFMLASAITWAVGTVLSKSILESMSPLRLAFLSSLTTMPIHLGISVVALSRNPEAWQQIATPSILAAIVYSGVFSTGVAYATWHAGVRAVGGSHAAVYQNVVTLVAVIGGWLLLREQMFAAQILGGFMTVAGLLIMRRGR